MSVRVSAEMRVSGRFLRTAGKTMEKRALRARLARRSCAASGEQDPRMRFNSRAGATKIAEDDCSADGFRMVSCVQDCKARRLFRARIYCTPLLLRMRGTRTTRRSIEVCLQGGRILKGGILMMFSTMPSRTLRLSIKRLRFE